MPSVAQRSANLVFISHAADDGRKSALAIRDALAAANFDPWIAPDSIPPGSDWDDEIDTALQGALALVVVLTPNAVRSHQVKGEWQFALARCIPAIPLLLAEIPIPRALSVLQWIDAQGVLDDIFEKLVRSLQMLRGRRVEYVKETLLALRVSHEDSTHPHRILAKITELETIQSCDQKPRLPRSDPSPPFRRRTWSASTAERSRVVGLPPLEFNPVFKDRTVERRALESLLTDSTARLISVVGRAGIGKTATLMAVLSKFHGKDPDTTTGPRHLDGIVYLDSTSPWLSYASVHQHCADLLPTEDADRLMQMLYDSSIPTRHKATELLQALAHGDYLLSVDHIDPALDADGHFVDADLRSFLDVFIRMPTGLRVVTTSRIPLSLDLPTAHCQRQVRILDGLPPADAAALLRDLDPHADLGLSDASDADLRRAAELVRGVPRALELIAGILATNIFSTLDDVLSKFYDSKDAFEKLIEASYRYLDNDSRYVLEALSVLGRPAPSAAVSHLLQDVRPAVSIAHLVGRLVRAQLAKVDRVDGMISIHPLDREYALKRIPKTGPYSLEVLHRRAALYYRQNRGSRRETLFDIEPQQAELEHLLASNELHEAALLLEDIAEVLNFRGEPRRLLEIARSLEKRATSDHAQLAITACLAQGYTMLGPLAQAECYLEQEFALRMAKSELQRAADVARRLGNVLRYQLRIEEAARHFHRSQELLHAVGDIEGATRLLYNLGLTAISARDLEYAKECSARYLEAASGKSDPRAMGDALSLAGLLALRGGEVSDAIGFFRRALDGYDQFENQGGTPHNREIYALNSLGLAYLQRDEAGLAIRYLLKGQERAARSGRARVDAFCSFNLSFAHLMEGDLARALATSERAGHILGSLDVPETAPAKSLEQSVRALGDGRRDDARVKLLDAARGVRDNFDLIDATFVEQSIIRLIPDAGPQGASRDSFP